MASAPGASGGVGAAGRVPRRRESIEAEVRKLNAVYRWGRMPSPRSAHGGLDRPGANFAGSVTKRSRRRRRRGNINIEGSCIANLDSSWQQGLEGSEAGAGAGISGSSSYIERWREDPEGKKCGSDDEDRLRLEQEQHRGEAVANDPGGEHSTEQDGGRDHAQARQEDRARESAEEGTRVVDDAPADLFEFDGGTAAVGSAGVGEREELLELGSDVLGASTPGAVREDNRGRGPGQKTKMASGKRRVILDDDDDGGEESGEMENLAPADARGFLTPLEGGGIAGTPGSVLGENRQGRRHETRAPGKRRVIVEEEGEEGEVESEAEHVHETRAPWKRRVIVEEEEEEGGERESVTPAEIQDQGKHLEVEDLADGDLATHLAAAAAAAAAVDRGAAAANGGGGRTLPQSRRRVLIDDDEAGSSSNTSDPAPDVGRDQERVEMAAADEDGGKTLGGASASSDDDGDGDDVLLAADKSFRSDGAGAGVPVDDADHEDGEFGTFGGKRRTESCYTGGSDCRSSASGDEGYCSPDAAEEWNTSVGGDTVVGITGGDYAPGADQSSGREHSIAKVAVSGGAAVDTGEKATNGHASVGSALVEPRAHGGAGDDGEDEDDDDNGEDEDDDDDGEDEDDDDDGRDKDDDDDGSDGVVRPRAEISGRRAAGAARRKRRVVVESSDSDASTSSGGEQEDGEEEEEEEAEEEAGGVESPGAGVVAADGRSQRRGRLLRNGGAASAAAAESSAEGIDVDEEDLLDSSSSAGDREERREASGIGGEDSRRPVPCANDESAGEESSEDGEGYDTAASTPSGPRGRPRRRRARRVISNDEGSSSSAAGSDCEDGRAEVSLEGSPSAVAVSSSEEEEGLSSSEKEEGRGRNPRRMYPAAASPASSRSCSPITRKPTGSSSWRDGGSGGDLLSSSGGGSGSSSGSNSEGVEIDGEGPVDASTRSNRRSIPGHRNLARGPSVVIDDDDDDDDDQIDSPSIDDSPFTSLWIRNCNVGDFCSPGSRGRGLTLSPASGKPAAPKTTATRRPDDPRRRRDGGGTGEAAKKRGGGGAGEGGGGSTGARAAGGAGSGCGAPRGEELCGAAFLPARDGLTTKFFKEFNEGVFGGALSDVRLVWSTRLKSTAGVTKCSRRRDASGYNYVSVVELSTKVLDSESKLRQTLLHELCHAAAWVVDHNSKPPHGAHFWAWADRAKVAHPGVPVTTCHSYDINYKYRYTCIGAGADPGRGCGAEIGRHSKSINVETQVCGRCKGRLALFGTHDKNGKLKKPRVATGFSLFVKERYAEVKRALPPGTKQQEVMKEVSRQWAARGNRDGGAGSGSGNKDAGDTAAAAVSSPSARAGGTSSRGTPAAGAKGGAGGWTASSSTGDKENALCFDLT